MDSLSSDEEKKIKAKNGDEDLLDDSTNSNKAMNFRKEALKKVLDKAQKKKNKRKKDKEGISADDLEE
jgi:hypothetical protein